MLQVRPLPRLCLPLVALNGSGCCLVSIGIIGGQNFLMSVGNRGILMTRAEALHDDIKNGVV